MVTEKPDLSGQLGPLCKPPAHLEGIKAPANKVSCPLSGWSLPSLARKAEGWAERAWSGGSEEGGGAQVAFLASPALALERSRWFAKSSGVSHPTDPHESGGKVSTSGLQIKTFKAQRG